MAAAKADKLPNHHPESTIMDMRTVFGKRDREDTGLPSDLVLLADSIVETACFPFGIELGMVGVDLKRRIARALASERLGVTKQPLAGKMTKSTVFMTSEDVCNRFGITQLTLHRWIRDERLKFPQPLKVKRKRLFNAMLVIQWEKNRTVA